MFIRVISDQIVERIDQGLTLVISPLIALMRDQVDALVALGVHAASLDSTQGMERSSWIKDEVLNGNMKILFVAPERYAFITQAV